MKGRTRTYPGEMTQEKARSRAVLREILDRIRGKKKGLLLFCGKHYRGPVVAAAIQPVLEGGTIVVVDGGNMFDPYVISRMARMLGVSPRSVLSRFYVSRGFSCYQVESLIVSELPDFVKKKRPAALIVTGPLETFYDSDIPLKESLSLLGGVTGALWDLSRKMPVMVVTPVPPRAAAERGHFFDNLLRKADSVYTPEGEAIDSPHCRYLQRGRSFR